MTTKLWKRNAVVAVVLLFICVGIYLNWSYNQEPEAEAASGTVELADTLDTALLDEAAKEVGTDETSGGVTSVDALTNDVVTVSDSEDYNALLTEANTDTSMTDYFATIRLARQESRDSAVELLQETIAYETGEDESALSTA